MKNNRPETERQFFQLREVAELMHVSKACVCQWIKHGKIPAVRVGKYPLIGKAFIDDLIQKSNTTFEGGQT
ncbi:excisionase family DNA-binding protein [Treponema endosymbiont of Eucomonympha sp.]|uniref:excisionase family DNA-binding protein n=1 Tax=Treponema endosymbiont of Eucomonympha sp. TaxID=1580831 RepID=UPI000782AA9D|nr:excisionase family DNA-binding protein [Treponema endosymbiont of Eucomonympha sp.]